MFHPDLRPNTPQSQLSCITKKNKLTKQPVETTKVVKVISNCHFIADDDCRRNSIQENMQFWLQ